MNRRFPLAAKILTWFSLNLLLLMLIAWVVLRYSTRSGFDSFLAGHVGGLLTALRARDERDENSHGRDGRTDGDLTHGTGPRETPSHLARGRTACPYA